MDKQAKPNSALDACCRLTKPGGHMPQSPVATNLNHRTEKPERPRASPSSPRP